ncbi:CLUMA_CG006655, isoform A [Clunio marinus]|uniref:CLUMA_CG006655, isoform A n=1 Tax=Clunio marinus TaxID=568069 RepID=A0A1J1HZV3_9DIPT|nr:CLUMA_CG006655, isoform A [Clunio marinus]
MPINNSRSGVTSYAHALRSQPVPKPNYITAVKCTPDRTTVPNLIYLEWFLEQISIPPLFLLVLG